MREIGIGDVNNAESVNILPMVKYVTSQKTKRGLCCKPQGVTSGYGSDIMGIEENNAITDGGVATLTNLLTIVIMHYRILSF